MCYKSCQEHKTHILNVAAQVHGCKSLPRKILALKLKTLYYYTSRGDEYTRPKPILFRQKVREASLLLPLGHLYAW